ncbi:MAG: DNA polymerase III subunit alpha, partial [Candidatus Eisenbacteria bacterium]
MPLFTPLRVRSHGTLLAGVASPEALAEQAAERGHTALALTDRDNLYLAVRFLEAAKAAGITPLPGAELTAPRTPPPPGVAARHGALSSRVLLLPFDRRGWANLCALITARHLEPRFDLVRALGEFHAGLHVIAESTSLLTALIAAGVPAAIAANDEPARPLTHRGGLWLGVRGMPSERPRLRARLDEARALGVHGVATGDVWMLQPGDHEAHRVAVTAGAGELLERMPPAAFCARDAWLASPQEWTRRVHATCAGAGAAGAAEDLLANNAAIVARSRFELERGIPIFPRAPLPPGVEAAQQLATVARTGFERRYPAHGSRRTPAHVHARAQARLAEELALIARMGFTDYFLLVADIVGFARARGIPTVGRGSGASSIVSYALGVTSVDPIRYGLCFERFLHPQRRDCPDLDVDLCWQRRDEVIAHVYERYGHDRVAMISTHATLGPRSAFREAAKTLGLPLARLDALARRVPRDLDPSALEQALAGRKGAHGLGPEFDEPRVREALRLAARLAGAPRHLSVHCGGLVIGDRALTHYLPLERSAKGVVVSQFEMRAVEAIGLVKMDLLGNRAITTIGECRALTGEAAPHPDIIPDIDVMTAEVLASGDTLNCFQLESPAMRHLLRMLQARTLDQTVAAVALVRPGPSESGMKESFCRRQRGLEPVTFPHERLRATLAETHGILLYEEDVMRVTHALCGMPYAQGETLRRAIAHARDDEEFRFLERGFLAQCAQHGVEPRAAHGVWRELTRFAAYAFCKAHAAGYGKLGWQSVYYKTRFPAAWAVGVLHHHAGMYPTWAHIEDLRRGGVHRQPVEFRSPCAARSGWHSALESGASTAAGGAIRVGLHRVQGLAHATGERLVAARQARPFVTLADMVDRVRPTPPELEALVLAGALDALPGARTRAAMLLEARVGVAVTAAAARGGRARRTDSRAPALSLPDGAPFAPEPCAPRPGGHALPELPELPLADRVRGEFAATG